MKRFKPLEFVGVYEFKDPDTGFVQSHGNLKELIQLIVSYRAQNGLEPLDALGAVIENYTCCLPENRHKCEEYELLDRSLMQVIQGGVAFLKNVAYKRFATQEVAEARGKQCLGCTFNVFPDRGPFITFADDLMVRSIGGRRVSMGANLGNCAACSCNLRSKVFYGEKELPPFKDKELAKMKSVSCWQLELSKQC